MIHRMPVIWQHSDQGACQTNLACVRASVRDRQSTLARMLFLFNTHMDLPPISPRSTEKAAESMFVPVKHEEVEEKEPAEDKQSSTPLPDEEEEDEKEQGQAEIEIVDEEVEVSQSGSGSRGGVEEEDKGHGKQASTAL